MNSLRGNLDRFLTKSINLFELFALKLIGHNFRMIYSFGLGRREFTPFIKGLGMMGYGQPHNIVKDVATPLLVRALVLSDQAQTIVHVHLELAFASMAVKEGLLSNLQERYPEWKLSHASLLVTATHTHSAPGGYSHYPFYNFTVPGFQKEVFRRIIDGALEAVEDAARSLAKGKLVFGEVSISPNKDVAFNRSMSAYSNNPEAKANAKNFEAIDRRMRGLLLESETGELRGILNWFGVHCTSVSSFNQSIHHDNKGVAAALFEHHYPGTVAFFLQSAAGDVSPNYVWDKKIKLMRGRFEDQYDSAAYNGELQFREAERISSGTEVSGAIRCAQTFFDMPAVTADPAHGIAFFKGTLEGPGMPPSLAPGLKVWARAVRTVKQHKSESDERFYREQAPKEIMLDHRTGSFLGVPFGFWKVAPKIPDPILQAFQSAAKANSIETKPWVPAIIPFQLIRLGSLLIATVPGEITTTAARRLEDRLKEAALGLEISDVIITSYANGYMGYVTTPEEYDQQCYEGGHTVYGRNTLRGITMALEGLVKELKGEASPYPHIPAFHFPPEELARRSF